MIQFYEFCCILGGTLRKTGAGASVYTEAGGVHPECTDILLWLEQDDVDLRSKEATQYHRPTETDRDAHGSGLYLEEETKGKTPNCCVSEVQKYVQ